MSLTTDLQSLVRLGVFTCCWCGRERPHEAMAVYDDDIPGFVCNDCWREAQESPAAQTVGEGSAPAAHDSSRDQHGPSPAGAAS